MKNLLIFFLLTTLPFIGSSQGEKNKFFKLPVKGSTDLQKPVRDFYPDIEKIAPAPGGKESESRLQKIKNSLPPKINLAPEKNKKKALDPIRGTRFEGNGYDGVPNDNDLAVSNAGILVSVTNSMIYMFNESGTLLKKISLDAFGDTLKINQNKYDPKVLYDPGVDRFILCYLNGRTDSTSSITMAFSQTPDPTGVWNIYSIPGNPLNDTSWSDFPMIELTKDELFFSINLLYNDSTWQKGFKQTIIWQIDKLDGFNGDSLSLLLHDNIYHGGKAIRNLIPVRGGLGPEGPNMYFLSNLNFARETDTFFLVEIPGKMDMPNLKVNVDLIRSTGKYGVPPVAEQRFIHQLETNDARVLGATYYDNKIWFAGNSRHSTSNKATIYHGILEDPAGNKKITVNQITHPYLEFGYPSVAFAGNKGGQDKCLIIANHTADSVNAGVSAIFYENGSYSDPLQIVRGETFVNAYPARAERWGDYTGLQVKYDEPGKFWCSGYFGKTKRTQAGTANVNGTYIAEVFAPFSAGIRDNKNRKTEISSFPNPVEDRIRVIFNQEKGSTLRFTLFSQNGKEIRTLLEELVIPGTHSFNFSLGSLPAGVYFLNITDTKTGEVIKTEKLIRN